MTTFDEARESVYERFRTSWTATPADTHYTFAGEDFSPPTSGAWVRLSVRTQAPGGQTLGPINGRRFTRVASVFVNIFTPENRGEAALGALMKAVTDLFEGVSFDGLRFFQADARETGTDGKWQTALVEAPFDYDESK